MSSDVKSNGGPSEDRAAYAQRKLANRQSRARVQFSRQEVDSQVREIVAHMVQGTFSISEHGEDYARMWGVTINTVEARAAQASRHLRMLVDPGTREELRGRWLSRLDDIVMHGEDKDVASAAKVASELAGLITKKHEVSAPPLMAMPPEERKRRLLAAREAIEAELAKEGQGE